MPAYSLALPEPYPTNACTGVATTTNAANDMFLPPLTPLVTRLMPLLVFQLVCCRHRAFSSLVLPFYLETPDLLHARHPPALDRRVKIAARYNTTFLIPFSCARWANLFADFLGAGHVAALFLPPFLPFTCWPSERGAEYRQSPARKCG